MKRIGFLVVVGLVFSLGSCSEETGGGGNSPGTGGGGGDGVAGSGGGGTADADWPLFGRDLNHSRANNAETAIGIDTVGGLQLAWEHLGVEVTSTPAVVDGVVYFADWDGVIYARNVADGSEVWTAQNEEAGITASLAVTDDRIFIGDLDAVFHALDRSTGEFLWSTLLDDHPNANIQSSATPIDGVLIVGVGSGELGIEKEEYTFRGSIVGLSQDDGEELWRVYVTEDDETSGAGVSVWSSPAVDPDRNLIFIGTGQHYEEPGGPMSDSLVAVNYLTGEVAWVRQFTENDVYRLLGPQGPDADIGAAPNLFTIGDQAVVGVGDKGGTYAVFDRDTGETVWQTKVGPGSHLGGIMGPAAVANGRIYITSNLWPAGFDTSIIFVPDFDLPENQSELVALDADTGEEEWRVSVPSPTIGGNLWSNGIVFSGHTLGLVQAFDARDGSPLWSDQVGASLASGQVVYNGRLLATHGFEFIGILGDPNGFRGGLRVYELPE